MHGIAKSSTRDESELQEEKEIRDKYGILLKKFLNRNGDGDCHFERHNRQEFSTEDLGDIGDALMINPDNGSLWNLRREIILRQSESLANLFENELRFTAVCLSINPKSYVSWFHRCWCLLRTPCGRWTEEMDLCTEHLVRDERNFHCWCHWWFISEQMNMSDEDRLTFVTKKLLENFSNYSAWHYRSQILIKLHTSNGKVINRNTLSSERSLTHNALFTDPSDQSPWLYYRWLVDVDQKRSNYEYDVLYTHNEQNSIRIWFRKAVDLMKTEFDVEIVNRNRLTFLKLKFHFLHCYQ